MAGMNIKVNGVTIKQPNKPGLSHYNITKSGRVSSGKMTMQLIAKKRKLRLTYEVLSGSDLDLILSLIDSNAMFFTVSYTENGVSKSMRAYVGEIQRKLNRGGTKSGWYWTDISFDFIEQ